MVMTVPAMLVSVTLLSSSLEQLVIPVVITVAMRRRAAAFSADFIVVFIIIRFFKWLFVCDLFFASCSIRVLASCCTRVCFLLLFVTPASGHGSRFMGIGSLALLSDDGCKGIAGSVMLQIFL